MKKGGAGGVGVSATLQLLVDFTARLIFRASRHGEEEEDTPTTLDLNLWTIVDGPKST